MPCLTWGARPPSRPFFFGLNLSTRIHVVVSCCRRYFFLSMAAALERGGGRGGALYFNQSRQRTNRTTIHFVFNPIGSLIVLLHPPEPNFHAHILKYVVPTSALCTREPPKVVRDLRPAVPITRKRRLNAISYHASFSSPIIFRAGKY